MHEHCITNLPHGATGHIETSHHTREIDEVVSGNVPIIEAAHALDDDRTDCGQFPAGTRCGGMANGGSIAKYPVGHPSSQGISHRLGRFEVCLGNPQR